MVVGWKKGMRVKPTFLAFLAVLFALSATPSRAAEPVKNTYYYMVFSNPVPGTEAEYADWYQNRHQYDVAAVPGIVSVQRFVASDVQLRNGAKPKQKYVVIYKVVTDDLATVMKEVNRRATSGETYVCPCFDRNTAGGGIYKASGAPSFHTGAGNAQGDTYLHIVFNNAKPGTDDAFRVWYPGRHVPDMVAIPGFVRGQFSVLDEGTNRRKENKKYMSLFTVVTNDIGKVAAAFHNAPKMKMDASFDPEAVEGYTYKAMEPEISSDGIRAMRAAAKGK